MRDWAMNVTHVTVVVLAARTPGAWPGMGPFALVSPTGAVAVVSRAGGLSSSLAQAGTAPNSPLFEPPLAQTALTQPPLLLSGDRQRPVVVVVATGVDRGAGALADDPVRARVQRADLVARAIEDRRPA